MNYNPVCFVFVFLKGVLEPHKAQEVPERFRNE